MGPLLSSLNGPAGTNSDARGAILQSVAELGPDNEAVRAHLREALDWDKPLSTRQGAVRGFYFVENPTREEYLLVVGQSYVIGLCVGVLEKPSWERVRVKYGIKGKNER